MIHLTPAEPTDAYELQLRSEDAREVSPDWRQNVAVSILEGGVTAARDDQGRLVALYGLTFRGRLAVPWLLCAPLVEQHKATAWRIARRFMRHLARPAAHEGYVVTNLIPQWSTGNRRFVAALGFHFRPSGRPGWDAFYLPPHV